MVRKWSAHHCSTKYSLVSRDLLFSKLGADEELSIPLSSFSQVVHYYQPYQYITTDENDSRKILKALQEYWEALISGLGAEHRLNRLLTVLKDVQSSFKKRETQSVNWRMELKEDVILVPPNQFEDADHDNWLKSSELRGWLKIMNKNEEGSSDSLTDVKKMLYKTENRVHEVGG